MLQLLTVCGWLEARAHSRARVRMPPNLQIGPSDSRRRRLQTRSTIVAPPLPREVETRFRARAARARMRTGPHRT